MVAELRVDPETGDWHIVAPGRASRPVDGSTTADGRCPFCPGNEALTPPEVFRIPAGGQWRIRVVPNRYPAVSPAASTPAASTPGPAAATGQHEVVIESTQHDWDLRSASMAETTELMWVMRERCRAMALRRPAAIVVFRNHGVAAGTSLLHPHSQIVALDQAPPGLTRRWHLAQRFFADTGRCLQEEIAAAERVHGARVVDDTDGVLTYQPKASGVPHQTVLLASGDSADLAGASDEAIAAVARTLPRLLRGLAAILGDPAYNLVVHGGPNGDDTAHDWYRWYVALYPRITRRGGLEIATGLGVNPTRPEDTAPLLRRAVAVQPA